MKNLKNTKFITMSTALLLVCVMAIAGIGMNKLEAANTTITWVDDFFGSQHLVGSSLEKPPEANGNELRLVQTTSSGVALWTKEK